MLSCKQNRFTGTDPVVAIAAGIALSGPSGAAAGTAISSITAGDSFAVFNYKGVLRSITITAENAGFVNRSSYSFWFHAHLLPLIWLMLVPLLAVLLPVFTSWH
jgi:hypothetical protein